MSNGKEGERLFQQMMEERGYQVTDVSNDSRYWPLDIDFIITSPTTGEVKSFEVKWCSNIHNTHNMFLEIENPRSRQWLGDGWWKHCKADYLAYGDAQTSLFYIFPMDQLRQRVETMNLRTARTRDGSVGLLAPLSALSDIVAHL